MYSMNVGTSLDRKRGREVSIDARSDLEVAALRLTSEGIGSLVVPGGHHRILGVLSEGDLGRALPLDLPSATALTCGSKIDGVPMTCSPHDSIREVKRLMTQGRACWAPVLVDGTVVGIVGVGDLELEVGVPRDCITIRRFSPQ